MRCLGVSSLILAMAAISVDMSHGAIINAKAERKDCWNGCQLRGAGMCSQTTDKCDKLTTCTNAYCDTGITTNCTCWD
jgi:hypothetical protein